MMSLMSRVPEVIDQLLWLNLQAGLLAVIVSAVCCLPRRWISAHWRSMLWMLVFIRLLVPSGPTSVLSLSNLMMQSAEPVVVVPVIVKSTTPASVVPEFDAFRDSEIIIPPVESPRLPHVAAVATRAMPWTLRNIGIVIWAGVAAFLLGRLIWLVLSLRRRLFESGVIQDPRLLKIVRETAREASLYGIPRLLWGPAGPSPAVCGWLFPTLLLPRESSVLQGVQLRLVLLHEFRHIRAGDTLLTWIPRLLCSLCWFNPLLWWAAFKWREERELACDEWVLQKIGNEQKRNYLEALLTIALESQRTPALVFTASIVSSLTLLERRIVAMKRFRSSTRTGVITGSVLTLLIAAIGLTDAVRAENEPDASGNLAPVRSAVAGPTTLAVARQATPAEISKVLKPTVTFARHVILWDGKEILTKDQLRARLAELRKLQPVKPVVYQSLGSVWNGIKGSATNDEADQQANQRLAEVLELIGKDQWSLLSFLSRRGSAAVDHIRSEKDLQPDPNRSFTGIVAEDGVVGSADQNGAGDVRLTPAKGAQVVIIPDGEPADVSLRDGKLREPQDEIWYETNASGIFQADPAALEVDPVLLAGAGKYSLLILHDSGYRVGRQPLDSTGAYIYHLKPWVEVNVDTRNLKPSEHVELWMTPTGADEKFPALAVATLRHSEIPIKVRVPDGSGRAAYSVKEEDVWRDTEFRHPFTITHDGPKELVLPKTPG